MLTKIKALPHLHSAEAQGKSLLPRPVRGIAKQVMESVHAMCEWRLGHSPLQDVAERPVESPPPKSVEEIVACLKRIRTSIKLWTQKSGRQGYFNFVQQFIV